MAKRSALGNELNCKQMHYVKGHCCFRKTFFGRIWEVVCGV